MIIRKKLAGLQVFINTVDHYDQQKNISPTRIQKKGCKNRNSPYVQVIYVSTPHRVSNRISGRTSVMNIKERPNHRIYIQTLRGMSPEERLNKSFELSEMAKELFLHGLRKRFPALSESSIRKIYLERLEKCHNRNY